MRRSKEMMIIGVLVLILLGAVGYSAIWLSGTISQKEDEHNETGK